MKHCLFILLFFISTVITVHAQRSERENRGGFSLSTLAQANDVPDSLIVADTISRERIIAYRLTPLFGNRYRAPMDTMRLNIGQSTLVEANSLSVAYLANVGSAAQTRIFSERKEPRDFIYADPFDYYITTPEKAYYYDTRIPYTDITYTTAGSAQNKEERVKGFLTTNFGKAINVGADLDYIYARGQYNSNGNKLMSYRMFGSYRSDKYELNLSTGNFNFVNYENGGFTDDNQFTNPEEYRDINGRIPSMDEYETFLSNTWNRVRGKQFYLSHRYNLGFYKVMERPDEEGEIEEFDQFVPVSSIIHTVDYHDNRRHFTSTMAGIDTLYQRRYIDPLYNTTGMDPTGIYVYGKDPYLSDRTSTWNLKNTVALSLREGFQDWVKFGLTAYVSFEKRRFKLPAKIPGLSYGEDGYLPQGEPTTLNYPLDEIHDEFTTYVGAELAKTQGSLFTFNARGELGVIGTDAGELRVDGDLQTRFSLLNKEASLKATGYVKNVTPAFYQRHHHSRYLWWDRSLKNVQQFYVGGEAHLAYTGTTVSAGLESIQNYVYFGSNGLPEQHDSNIQVISARIKQNFYYKALGWENEAAYQLSSNKDILPLPDLSAYSNLYVHFKLFKVLTMQIGADVHYFTKYNAPYYEPATMQFQLQDPDDRVKIGNYPLINAYANFHLKQARFFIMGYNLSALFMDPEYFTLRHYALNPMVLKMGISVMFNN